MTQDRLLPELLELMPSLARHVPPAKLLDKTVYSPSIDPTLHQALRRTGIHTLVVTGGEAEVCVLATGSSV